MKFKVVGIFISVVIVLMLGVAIVFFMPAEETTMEEKKQGHTVKNSLEEEGEDSDLKKIETVLKGFADTIYVYDTRQRKYYEGAEKYMTQRGYEKFKPLDIERMEESSETPEPVPVISNLQDVNFYYKQANSQEVEVIMEADVLYSSTGKNSNRQYLKLQLKKSNDDWLISECEIVATMDSTSMQN